MKKVSVVIEWENVLLAEMDRCRRMLRELRRQILELNSPVSAPVEFEIIVVFDQEIVPAAAITGEFTQIFLTGDPHILWRLTPATGLNYYDLKNFGTAQADGDIILFLDSDVIPEPGWLKTLLGSFNDPAVEVACGNTFLDLTDFLGRAMALIWFFPLRSTDSVLRETPRFFGNNVAFRRPVAARFPFPKMLPGATRGSCVHLAGILHDSGIKIYQHSGAQVCHPPPNGWNLFFIRGVAAGRDEMLVRRVFRGKPWFGRESFRALHQCVKNILRGCKSVIVQRKAVKLSPGEIPLAMGVVLIYSNCRLLGAWGTQLFPKLMGRHFRV